MDSKNKIIIDIDGWVWVEDRDGDSYGLGDLGVDVVIDDRREDKHKTV